MIFDCSLTWGSSLSANPFSDAGYLIYFTYGIRNSKAGELAREEIVLTKPPISPPKFEAISDQNKAAYNE